VVDLEEGRRRSEGWDGERTEQGRSAFLDRTNLVDISVEGSKGSLVATTADYASG